MPVGTEEVDLVVIGTGPGGEALAGKAAAAGLSVVAVERHLVGGECPYYGCIPSKIIVRGSEAIAESHRLGRLAGEADVRTSWGVVADRISREATDGWDDRAAADRLRALGVDVVHGSGRLAGQHTVQVDHDNHQLPRHYRTRRGVVLNTGTRPAEPPIAGLRGTPYWTNRDAVRTRRLPRTMIILGGGTVGCELAQAFARFGVGVTVVEPGPRLLGRSEPEASAVIDATFQDDQICVLTGHRPVAVRHNDAYGAGPFDVELDDGRRLGAECLLVATGRVANLDDIGLETVGLQHAASDGQLTVDEHLRVQGSLNSCDAPWLWAIGDITGHGGFTHLSMYQAGLALKDILGQDPEPAQYHAIPSVTFTDPEVAAVGLTAAQAVASGLAVTTGQVDLTQSSRGLTHGLHRGLIKLVAHQGALVGATVVGPAAGEICSILTLAVHTRLSTKTLAAMIYAYPTFHRAIESALASLHTT